MTEQETIVQLATAAQTVGVLPAALQDAITRGLKHFEGASPDAIDIRSWAESLRHTAIHFFSRARAAPATVSSAELQSLAQLPPIQRITRFRMMRAGGKA